MLCDAFMALFKQITPPLLPELKNKQMLETLIYIRNEGHTYWSLLRRKIVWKFCWSNREQFDMTLSIES